MKWSLTHGGSTYSLSLPEQLLDEVELPAELNGEAVLLRWHPGLQTLYLRKPGSPLERCIRVRFSSPGEPSPSGAGTHLHLESGGFGETPWETTIDLATGGNGKVRKSTTQAACIVRSPLTGKVLQVLKTPGQRVIVNEPIAIIEAMKMENKICAPRAGTIQKISIGTNALVQVGSELAIIH